MTNVVAFHAIRDEGYAMRNIPCLPLGRVALVSLSCAVRGGICKEHKDPDTDVKDIAILDWSTCESCRVIRIDRKDFHWSSIDPAHPSPRSHTIMVGTHHEGFFIVLLADFLARSILCGQSSRVRRL